MSRQTKGSFTASLQASKSCCCGLGGEISCCVSGLDKQELQQNCFLYFLINFPVYTAFMYSSGCQMFGVVLQKGGGNDGVVELSNLTFDFNPQAVLPGLQMSLVLKFGSH